MSITRATKETAFDATIKALLQERQNNDLQTEKSGIGVVHAQQRGDLDSASFSALAEEGGSIGPENSALETLVSSVNPWF